MGSGHLGLVLRGSLLKSESRSVRPKSADAFIVYEARVLTDADVAVVTFYDAAEMETALRGVKQGGAVELPVYGRVWNKTVYLHYRRSAQSAAAAA